MRFWLINTGEPTPLDSGQQRLRRVGMLSETLAKRGHEVLWWNSTFFHMGKRHRFDADASLEVDAGYRIRFLHGPKYERNVSLQRLRNHAVLGRKFRQFAAEESRPDLVLTSLPTIELSYEAAQFGRREGIPTVVDVRDLWPESFLELAPSWGRSAGRVALWPYFRMARRACADATAICGNTREFVDWGLANGRREATELDRDFPFGYAPPELKAQEREAAEAYWRSLGVGVQPGTPIACFFGAINHHFDFDSVLAAARQLQATRRIQFVFCGDGEDRARLAAGAKENADVIFSGWVDAARIWTLMEQSSFGLAPYVPCPNFIKNVPNKPIEYLAGGLPILSSLSDGALSTLIASHDCGACYGSDSGELVRIIASLLDEPARLAAMKERSKRAFEEEFHATSVYGRMAAHLEGIAANFPGR